MVRFISLLFLGVLAFTAMPQPAIAKEPTARIKSLYADYQSALALEDLEKANSLARKLWKQSEKLYGDSKQTGDFAYNFAVIGMTLTRKHDSRTGKAYERSIELAHFHGDTSSTISLKRHTAYAMYLLNRRNYKKARSILNNADNISQDSNLTKTAEYAFALSLQAETAYELKLYEEAITYIDKSLHQYASLEKSNTVNARKALVIKADIDAKLGNWQEALAGYETVYMNVDRYFDEKHPYIGRAYVSRERLTSRLLLENKSISEAQIEEALSCPDCWPNFEEKYRPNIQINSLYQIDSVGLVKWPRNTPYLSGFVVYIYDIDNHGKPVNFRFANGSHLYTFDKPAAKLLKRWRVRDLKTGEPVKNVQGLVATISYYSYFQESYADFYGNPTDRRPPEGSAALNNLYSTR